MKCNNTMYSGGLYVRLKEELKEVMDDLDNDENLFVVSVKTTSGLTVYSLPGTLSKCKNMLNDFISATENSEMYLLGVTWINTAHAITARICKYIPKEECEYYD